MAQPLYNSNFTVDMQKVKPKKALGQHFLTDLSVADRIASSLDDYTHVPVLEVGPGMGVLTRPLINKGHDVKVAEIDTESVAYLRNEFPELAAADGIVEGDFLTLDLATVFHGAEKICVIGNYPYNISSQIFFHVLEYRDLVVCCSGMLQREVAMRLAAAPGSRDRGILSVLLQAWYDVSYLFTVDEHVFHPAPKVKSGVIKMVRNDVTSLGCDERLFKSVVKAAFGQRRKTLRNAIKSILPPGVTPAVLEQLNDEQGRPMMQLRPEQLSVADFIALTNAVAQLRG